MLLSGILATGDVVEGKRIFTLFSGNFTIGGAGFCAGVNEELTIDFRAERLSATIDFIARMGDLIESLFLMVMDLADSLWGDPLIVGSL